VNVWLTMRVALLALGANRLRSGLTMLGSSSGSER